MNIRLDTVSFLLNPMNSSKFSKIKITVLSLSMSCHQSVRTSLHSLPLPSSHFNSSTVYLLRIKVNSVTVVWTTVDMTSSKIRSIPSVPHRTLIFPPVGSITPFLFSHDGQSVSIEYDEVVSTYL